MAADQERVECSITGATLHRHPRRNHNNNNNHSFQLLEKSANPVCCWNAQITWKYFVVVTLGVLLLVQLTGIMRSNDVLSLPWKGEAVQETAVTASAGDIAHDVPSDPMSRQRDEANPTLEEKKEKTVAYPFRLQDTVGEMDANRETENPTETTKENWILGVNMDNFEKPSLLCTECWDIVQKSPVVELSFVNVSTGEHPHKGAVDAEGNSGFVYDITKLHRDPPQGCEQTLSLNETKSLCQRHDMDYRILQRIHIAEDYRDGGPKAKSVRLLCGIYSAEPYHNKLRDAFETWAPKCDGFLVASNVTDPSFAAVGIDHPGPEMYKNMWQKVRTIWAYIYDNYYNDFDWFHLGGDDMWVIVENLKQYLDSDEIRTAASVGVEDFSRYRRALFLGSRFYFKEIGTIFNTGGPGYTMNQAALKLLVTMGLPNYQQKVIRPTEDVQIAKVFRRMNVVPYPTRDQQGSERYHHMTPGNHANVKLPKYYLEATRIFNTTLGMNHSSTESISFHQLKPMDMQRFHLVLYGHCISSPGLFEP